MRHALRFLLLFLSLLVLPATASAGDGPFTGDWLRLDSPDEEQARLDAIESLVVEFPRLFRGLVRNKLVSKSITPGRYLIDDAGDEMTISVDDGVPRTTKLDGTPIEFDVKGSGTISLGRERKGDEIHTAVTASGGEVSSRFALVDGNMRVTISIVNERLPRPLVYSLTYVPQTAAAPAPSSE